MNKPTYIIIHHEAPPVITNVPRFKIVDEYHKRKGFPKSNRGYYCGYHYFIEKSVVLIQSRNDNEIGAHTIGYNDKSIGICLAGNFDVEFPTSAQISVLRTILGEKTTLFDIPINNILPHRSFSPKSCYGSKLFDDWAKNLLIENQRITILTKLRDLYAQLLELLKGRKA